MKNFIGLNLLSLFGILIFCSTAFALNLQEAKTKGLVGETPSGYLAVVKVSPEAQALVQDINAKRKAAYSGIAAKNGAPLDEVARAAGREAIAKAPPGSFVQNEGGQWRQIGAKH
jgi:hypothetical protein